MTNFDFIMTKMTERNFADIFCNRDIFWDDIFWDRGSFGRKIDDAFEKWRDSTLNAFTFENWRYIHNIWERKGRKDSLSFQVWLSKQYNLEEWSEN